MPYPKTFFLGANRAPQRNILRPLYRRCLPTSDGPMSPAQVLSRPQRVAPAPTAADPAGRLLSVAEIQRALRVLRQRGRANLDDLLDGPHRPGRTADDDGADPALNADEGTVCSGADTGWPNTADEGPHGGDPVAVVAGHAGAGASTVALAIVDALSAAGRPARLIETAVASRSGLVAVATAELGVDPTGGWRRGSRQLTTVYRRTAEPAGGPDDEDWPGLPAADPAVLTVLDLGLPSSRCLSWLAARTPRTVVVCRLTVPGVRQAEQLLAQVGGWPLVAAVGGSRWPGPVLASLGPRLRDLREGGQVVCVGLHSGLQMSGPTQARLPRPVAAAGRALLARLDPAAR